VFPSAPAVRDMWLGPQSVLAGFGPVPKDLNNVCGRRLQGSTVLLENHVRGIGTSCSWVQETLASFSVPRIVVFVLVFDNHARAATHNGHAVCLGLVATTKAEAREEKLAMMMEAISNQCFC
jgi:hypothetical protein